MGIAIILAAALAWWLHARGELLPNLARWAGVGVAALMTVRMLETGRPLVALLAAGAGWAWWRWRVPPSPEQRAAALLRVAADADAETIHSAWRARMAEVHPDAGGSDGAARAMTAARDLLLSRRR